MKAMDEAMAAERDLSAFTTANKIRNALEAIEKPAVKPIDDLKGDCMVSKVEYDKNSNRHTLETIIEDNNE